MKLGYFMMPLHHIDRDYHQTLQEDVEAVIHADELGFSAGFGFKVRFSGQEAVFDYAFTEGGNLDAVHRIGLGFGL